MYSFEELERIHYANGLTWRASLYAAVCDAESEAIDILEYEKAGLKEDIHKLEQKLAECDC